MLTLNLRPVLEIDGVVVGYGTTPHDMFEVAQEAEDSPLSKSVHIAFSADSKEMVQSFYETAIALGAKCNGPPGLRPHYEPDYYAAFVFDLDGHNIEAVYSPPRR